ncbi:MULTISPECIES: hypothetical protein [Mediterranea]|uniref:hypothetical protein n=1 Tax=Mediterranea TaxID=1926659 RepID=UPI00201182FA|nr:MULTISPECIES: hypothetical protein [Mediterranea]MCL1608156.1 hypothetical protein [Mediterranea sp. ET5]MDM8122019.1 hypothetical protein [Mediterranea massiliensis]MDM8198283.1 hypothetical protein [Mediterranea massiliensis]
MSSFVRTCPYRRADASPRSYERVRTNVGTRRYETGDASAQNRGWDRWLPLVRNRGKGGASVGEKKVDRRAGSNGGGMPAGAVRRSAGKGRREPGGTCRADRRNAPDASADRFPFVPLPS